MGTAIKHPERQSARMSKITNDGLTRSGTGCYPYGNGVQTLRPIQREGRGGGGGRW